MSSVSGFSGVYAVDWAQTAPGEEWGLPPDMLAIGMSWRWSGTPRRLDAGVEALWLDRPQDRADPRQRARRRMRRLALAPMEAETPDPAADSDLPRDSMMLTDGRRVYAARIVAREAGPLAVFHPLLPPPDTPLWICGLNRTEAPAPRGGVICFLPGTLIDTPQGRRAVETLQPGEAVLTRDNGPQPLLWRGETRLSGAELYLNPHLRPIRIAAGALPGGGPEEELLVSPAHRLLMRAPFGSGAEEVLVAAGDLEDGRAIRRDFALGAVSYIHVMLAHHEILRANGQPCESFHPGLTDARVLKWHARTLEKAMPGLLSDPGRYGEPARRCLSRGEAGILRAVLA